MPLPGCQRGELPPGKTSINSCSPGARGLPRGRAALSAAPGSARAPASSRIHHLNEDHKQTEVQEASVFRASVKSEEPAGSGERGAGTPTPPGSVTSD